MRAPGLKLVRAAAAALVFGALLLALLDFRGAVPPELGRGVAAVQVVPSWLAVASGTSLAVGGALVLLFTLLAGRVYCAAICPLGIWQDLVAHLAERLGPRRNRYPTRPARNGLRQIFLWATVASLLAGGAGLVLALVDPYSQFARAAAALIRPLVVAANNALVLALRPFGVESLYRVALGWAPVGVLMIAAIGPLVVTGLAIWRGRIYCNTFCPVGTVLGVLASRSALRLKLDPAACRKCGDCLRACRAQCIDVRAGTIDASRCVACYNCLSVCAEGGIRHQWTWRRRPTLPAKAPGPDPGRRAFVAIAAAAVATLPAQELELKPPAKATSPAGGPICPPGADSVERFLAHCTACQLCVSACPTHVLAPAWWEYGAAGVLKPRLDYAAAFCNYDCHRCAEACPDGAIRRLALADKQVTRIGAAQLDVEACIVKTKGTDCAACSEHCPTKAVDTVPYGDNLRLPQVNPDLCIGCGACEFACPAKPRKAIVVAARPRHERAQRRVEPKAADPRHGNPFPF
ncbi:MAG: 4Fe-4S binding protein [Verrucomicrobia bacterium]|nr:4Fe-4S binding protein [Verrucomicrobiota bacterium]